MAFAIQKSFDNYITHWGPALRKSSGMVKVPQLFMGKKPVLPFSSVIATTPKVTSQKWVCYCADPTQAIYQHNVADYDMGGYGDLNRIFPGLSRNKKTECSSGLTVSIKGIRNAGGNTWSEASLRITRSSISTSYINVFCWACYADSSVSFTSTPFAQYSNDADFMNVSTASIYPKGSKYVSGTGGGSSAGYIDGVKWAVVQNWVSIPKGSSGTYLYIASPWATINNSYPNPTVTGWGIILEPTNSNTYPM